MGNAGSVVSRERLIDEVWDVNWFGSTKTLDVHVSGLRKKLGDDPSDPRYLHTVRGVGFRFAAGSRMTARHCSPVARGYLKASPRDEPAAALLAAFGYVLIFAILALEVPLTLNFSRRVDSEIRAEASLGSAGVAAAASGRLRSPALDRPRAPAGVAPGRPRDRGRRGRALLVDSDGAARPRHLLPQPARDRRVRCAAPRRRARATATR